METGTEDTLKARVPEWVYKECKKIGGKQTDKKEETRKTIFVPHEDRAAQQMEQEVHEEAVGDTPQRNEDEEETLPGRPILLPKAGSDTFWREEEQTQPNIGEEWLGC